MRICHIINLLILFSTTLSAFNHPEIDWKSVSTKHFIINYYENTEPAVYATWKIAEAAYATLADLYDYTPREKIALSLADYDDYSNGFAEWTSASIMIWLPDSRFELRSNTTWLRNVITHELTHIISLESKKRVQMIDVAIGLSCATPDEEYGVLLPTPRITTYPAWLAEGIAQFEADALGNDCFDSRREMLLRCAVRSNTLLSLEEMSAFNHDRIGSEQVYNQGYAFTRYLSGKVGTEKLHKVFRTGASEARDFSRLFREVTGKQLPDLYNSWLDSLRSDYARRFPAAEETFSSRYKRGRFNLRPEISSDGTWWAWLSSGSDDGGRTDLLVAPYGSVKPKLLIPYAHNAHCFSPGSDRIYYVKSRTPAKSGSYFNDIYYRDLPEGTEHRLTRAGRVYDISPIPGSENLLCVAYRSGAFGLYTCNTATGFLTVLLPGDAGSPIVNSTVNPENPDSVILSRIINGQSRLFRFSLSTKQLEPLSPGGAQEESPHWATDGRVYYSADYDGIFNIYSVLPDGSDLKRHTTTTGGFFSPRRTPDGKLAVSHYRASGFEVAILPPADTPFPLPESNGCTFRPLPVPTGKVTIKDRPYSPKYRRSVSELMLMGDLTRNSSLITGQFSSKMDSSVLLLRGGISKYQSDALHKKERVLQLAIGAGALFGEEPSNNRSLRSSLLNIAPRDSSPFLEKAINRRLSGTAASRSNRRYAPPPPRFSLVPPSRTTLQQSASDTTDSAQASTLFFGAAPLFAMENRCAAPTFGLELSAELAAMFLPQFITFTPYMELQLAREWTTGIRLNFVSMPFSGFPLYGTLPVYLQWVHPGRYNEDMTYNYGDLLQLELGLAPRFIPSFYEGLPDSTGDRNDTAVVGGIGANVSFFYGLPVLKYASIQLMSYTTGTYHSKRTRDDMVVGSSNGEPFINGYSNSYVASINSIRAVFPLFRTINRGRRYYFDALYGYVGYQLFGYANSSFFDHTDEFGPEMFSDVYYRPESIRFEHTVSAGITMGHNLSYLFFRQLSFDFSYFILNEQFSLSLTSGF